MKLIVRIAEISVLRLTRLACVFALFGLATMAYSVLVPKPLPVIFAMSVGHGFGAVAFVCYLLAVVLDAARRRAETGHDR